MKISKKSEYEAILVSDLPETVSWMIRRLQKFGVGVTHAVNLGSTIQLTELNPIDLILVHLEHSSEDSIQICRSLNNETSCDATPIILFGNTSDEEKICRGFEAGVVDYISRRMDKHEFNARLVRCLHRSSEYYSADDDTRYDQNRKLERHIRQSQKMESIELLAEGIAHDLNNILGGMIGYISLLKAKAKANDESLSALNMIESASERATRVISQLLDFACNKVVSMQPLSLNNEIKKSLNLIKSSIRYKIKFDRKLGRKLPQIWGDSTQVKQVIMNLAFAAIHSLPDRYPELLIKTELITPDHVPPENSGEWKHGDYVRLKISVTKIIGKNTELPEIKEKHQSLSYKRFDSAGLDLAIVRDIVNDYHGYFFIDNKNEKYSSFSVYFPIFNNKDVTPLAQQTGTIDTGKNVTKRLILVIDDESIILQLIRDSLELLGFEGLFASSGSEGLTLFHEYIDQIDLVILDLLMPDISGEEILTRLRKLRPELKILVASGYDYKKKAGMMAKLKVNDYLSKPFKIHDLKEKLDKLI